MCIGLLECIHCKEIELTDIAKKLIDDNNIDLLRTLSVQYITCAECWVAFRLDLMLEYRQRRLRSAWTSTASS